MALKQPYIPLYIGDWEKDTNCLTNLAEFALLKLTFKLFNAEKRGVFYANFRSLSVLFKTDLEQTKEIFNELIENKVLEIGTVEDGKFEIKSRRMLRETGISETRAANGKKGGESKTKAKPKQTVSKSEAKLLQNPDNDNDINNDIKVDIEKEKKEFFSKNFEFFETSRNCRVLSEIHKLPADKLNGYYVRFFDEKIDIGELNNKSPGDIVKHFSLWLPKILAKGEPPTSTKETKLTASQRRQTEFLSNFPQ